MTDSLADRAYLAAMTLYRTDPVFLVRPTREQFAHLDPTPDRPPTLEERVAEQRRLMDGHARPGAVA